MILPLVPKIPIIDQKSISIFHPDVDAIRASLNVTIKYLHLHYIHSMYSMDDNIEHHSE
jgi:hypothetical protein